MMLSPCYVYQHFSERGTAIIIIAVTEMNLRNNSPTAVTSKVMDYVERMIDMMIFFHTLKKKRG